MQLLIAKEKHGERIIDAEDVDEGALNLHPALQHRRLAQQPTRCRP